MKTLNIFAFLGILLICISFASAVSITSTETNPSTIAPGKGFTLTIDLKNNLDEDVTNAGVSIDFANIPFSPESSSEKFIGDMDNNDKETVEFDLTANSDADAGTYKIPVQISYKIVNTTQTIQRTSFVSVIVNAKPELELSSDSILIIGQKNKLQVQITNKGLAKAKFLEVQLNAGSYDILSSDKVYIGDLNSNDYDTANFDIFLNGNSLIPVTVTYTDFKNNQYSESKVLVVKSYTQKQAQELGLVTKSDTLTYIVIVVVVIIAYLIYRRIRKRKKKIGA